MVEIKICVCENSDSRLRIVYTGFSPVFLLYVLVELVLCNKAHFKSQEHSV